MNLSDHFGKFTCKTLKSQLGITTVEEALRYSDEHLMKCKGIGRMFCYHLRQIEITHVAMTIPTRMFCQICGHVHKIDFWVTDEIWNESIHPKYRNGPVCLSCFTERADERLLFWDRVIKFIDPCSMATQIDVQNKKP